MPYEYLQRDWELLPPPHEQELTDTDRAIIEDAARLHAKRIDDSDERKQDQEHRLADHEGDPVEIARALIAEQYTVTDDETEMIVDEVRAHDEAVRSKFSVSVNKTGMVKAFEAAVRVVDGKVVNREDREWFAAETSKNGKVSYYYLSGMTLADQYAGLTADFIRDGTFDDDIRSGELNDALLEELIDGELLDNAYGSARDRKRAQDEVTEHVEHIREEIM
jgi:hypothetical protein